MLYFVQATLSPPTHQIPSPTVSTPIPSIYATQWQQGRQREAIAPAADSDSTGGSNVIESGEGQGSGCAPRALGSLCILGWLASCPESQGQRIVEQRQRRTPRIAESLPLVDSGDLHAWRAVLPHHHPYLFLRMSSPSPNCNTESSFPFH
jgi:hypothetical protein